MVPFGIANIIKQRAFDQSGNREPLSSSSLPAVMFAKLGSDQPDETPTVKLYLRLCFVHSLLDICENSHKQGGQFAGHSEVGICRDGFVNSSVDRSLLTRQTCVLVFELAERVRLQYGIAHGQSSIVKK